jgi:hypothetical protein
MCVLYCKSVTHLDIYDLWGKRQERRFPGPKLAIFVYDAPPHTHRLSEAGLDWGPVHSTGHTGAT